MDGGAGNSAVSRLSPLPGAPLPRGDLDRPEHMATVRAAYDAFPAIASKWGW